MFNLKYEITVEDGRPYIKFPKDENIDHPEHKFMGIELTRYLLHSMLEDNKELQELEEKTEVEIIRSLNILTQISNRIGEMLMEQNNALDELGLDIQKDENE